MENKISFNINNGGKVVLTQSKHDKNVIVKSILIYTYHY